MWQSYLQRNSAFAHGLALVLASASIIGISRADSPVSAPAGFHRVQLLGNSDTIVALPFTRPVAAAGLVQAVAADVVQVSGMAAWTPSQFVYSSTQSNTYYMLICSGLLEGVSYPITDNGTDSLTLQLGGGSLAELQVGDRIAVIPYWTLGTVFPGGLGVHASPSRFSRRTEVLMLNLSGPGINLSADKIYYYYTNHWCQVGQSPSVSANDVLLPPSAYFIVRHNVATNTTLTVRGAVLTAKWSIALRTSSTQKEDNLLALPRPGALTLDESGLIASSAFVPSPSRFQLKDQLLTFDNELAGKNKSASGVYYYSSNRWLKVGSTNNVGGEQILKPGTGVVIRKVAATASPVWTNSPNY